VTRVCVKRRAVFHGGVHVGDGDQNLDGVSGEGLGDRELIQIARVIVVDGGPQQAGQIANRRGRVIGHCRCLNALQLGGRRLRERLGAIPSRASPAGQSLQDGTVLLIGT
jgi:hypothetical protein